MGAWGEKSTACDDIQDELDRFRDADGDFRKNLTKVQVQQRLSKVPLSDWYNLTRFHGVVMGLVEGAMTVPKPAIRKAIAEATKAMNSKKYLADWVSPSKRKAALASEVKALKKLLR